MFAITLSDVHKAFGPTSVLEGVNLQIKEGEFVSLIGPSGCGKTTLLRIIAGLDEPSSGEVFVNGDTPRQSVRQQNIGLASQRPALLPHQTALQNVQTTLDITGKRNRTSPRELLQTFGLADFVNHYPHQLSGGMQQRVNMACALAHHPSLLLLDEPFGALDALTRERMGEWLSRVLEETGQTVVFVTHSVEEAVVLSDRVVVFTPRPGRIDSIVTVPLARPRQRSVRVDTTTVRLAHEIREHLYRGEEEV